MLKKVAIAALTGILVSFLPEFTAEAAPASGVQIYIDPEVAYQNQPFGSQPEIEIRTFDGEKTVRYINFEGYVQATLVDSDPELLTGTTTVPVVSGMAVFDDLAVTEAGTARITFTAYRSTGEQYGTVTSEPFAVEDTEAPVITSTYLSYPYFGFVEVPANLAQNVEMAPDDVIQVTDNSGDESTLDISFSSSSGTPTCSSLIIFSDVRSCLAEAITNEVYATYTATDPSSNQAIAPTITFYSSRPTPSATFSTVTLSPSQASTDQGVINASVLEGGLLTLTAPAGTTFTAVLFASYGTPTGNTLGGCHAADSVSIVSAAFLGKETATVPADNGVFGDPCGGTYKNLNVSLQYEGSVTITVTLFDDSGFPLTLGGDSIYFESTLGLGDVDDLVDHDDGTYTATYTPYLVEGNEGSDLITPIVNSVPFVGVTITFAPPASTDATINAGSLAGVNLAGTFTGGADSGTSSSLTVTIPDADKTSAALLLTRGQINSTITYVVNSGDTPANDEAYTTPYTGTDTVDVTTDQTIWILVKAEDESTKLYYKITVTVASCYSVDEFGVLTNGSACTGSVTIDNSVSSIGTTAFVGNTAITSVTIGNSVTSIGVGAFYGSSSLASVTVGSSVTSIGSEAFANTALISVIIPDSVETIGNDAFIYNTYLASVTIGSAVESIGSSAFRGNALTSITIPNSVTSIGLEAFKDNASLASVTFLGDAPTVYGGAFSFLPIGATAYVSPTATGFSLTDGFWNGLIVTVSASATYSATTLAEAAANDGSITATITITLSNETFSTAEENFTVRVTNVPAGLTAVLIVGTDRTYATLSFTGTASSHANAHDIGNLTITFLAGDFQSGILPSGANRSNLGINFTDPAASTNADLSALVLSSGTLAPGFDSGTITGYTASVSNATTSVTVTPTKSDSNASFVQYLGSTGTTAFTGALAVGANIIRTVVTAEDGATTKTYTITVTRAVAVAASGAMEYEIVYKSNTVDDTSVKQDPRGYYKSGTTITVISQEPARRGYTFLIWNSKADGTGTSYKPGSKFDITKNITLFAQWKINQYTLSYSANGGPALTLASKTQDYGSYIKVLSVPESSMRTGYSFTAWNTKADGTGVSYVPTDIFVVDVVDTTLFAQWKINTYTITFSANGGPELKLDAITLEYGASVKVPSLPDASLRTGYSFMGWNVKSDGKGTSYLPASAFTMATSNITFFAQWKINQYTISFNSNGGPVLTLEAITQDYASLIKLPALPDASLRTGYTFIGWNTKNDGLGASYGAAENFTLGAANTVLFANWKINQYTISYDANGNNIGRAPALSSQDFNSTVVVAAPSRVFVRSGYSFIGWSKAKDGSGKLHQIGDTFTLGAGNELFYAAWKPNTYKVTFLNTTKDVLPTGVFQTGGQITSVPTPPARPGYSFMGWSSRASKTDIITLPYMPGVLKNITLYAVWVRTK